MTNEKIIDAASHLTPPKFFIWAQDNDLTPVIENYEDVLDLNRDKVIININGLLIEYQDGILKK